MPARILASLCFAFLACATVGAHAEGGAKLDDFAQRLFAVQSVTQKAYACFVRSYDASHLARHPRQKVGAMKLLVTVEQLPEEAVLSTSFRLGVTLRNRPGQFHSGGACGRAEVSEREGEGLAIGCSVDCDGGGIAVALAADNKSVIVRLDAVRVWRGRNPEEDAGLTLRAGADDRVFRLDRAGIETCAALVTDRKEIAAMRRK